MKTPRYENIRSVIDEDFVNLGAEFDGFLVGVTEKSASHQQHRGVYEGTPEFIAQAETRGEQTTPTLDSVVILMPIEKMDKSAFWDVVREPVPFLEGYNEAVAGLTVEDAGHRVVYELTKFREVGKSLREFSHSAFENKKATVDTSEQLIQTELGPKAPVFITRVYREVAGQK